MPRDRDGGRRQKWHTVHGSKKDAERELARLVHDLNTGEYVEPSRMTVGAYLERWLADYARSSVSGKTFERYEEIVRTSLIPGLGHILMAKLQPLQIQAFYSESLQNGRKDGRGGLSAQTVIHYHRVLRKALHDAVRWQLVARNPADSVEPPRPVRREMKVLDGDQVARLLEAAQDSWHYIPILLAVATGLRRGEILALRWEDIDLGEGILAVRRSLEQTRQGLSFKEPKTAKGRRTVVLPGMAVDELRRHQEEQVVAKLLLGPGYHDQGLVCAEDDGRPIIPDHVTRDFPVLVRKAGLPPIRFHDLRHTHATMLLREGIHPKVVSERLGHSTIGITLDTYSHVLPSMQEEAARRLDIALRAASLGNHGD
jgi:integrase